MWAPPAIQIFTYTKDTSATGSASRHLHHDYPWATFYPGPPGRPFFTLWPGMHAHCYSFQIQAHTFDTLQILVTLGIWLLCVQEHAHRSLTSSLQVYLQHWHVVYPTELHLHLQSHLLILTFRILIPGSAVPTPPFLHMRYCNPVAFSPTWVVSIIAPLLHFWHSCCFSLPFRDGSPSSLPSCRELTTCFFSSLC